ncbi:MAG: hypothetical protein IBJ00_04425 [Alphaproteobacteria bacterium]|nr:hypothetical protein [Alphaproteobacteria bacterium]
MKIYDKSPLRNNVLSPALKASYVLGTSQPTPLTLNFNFPRSFIFLLKYGVVAICSSIIGYYLIQAGPCTTAPIKIPAVVAITQLVEHPALNVIGPGIRDSQSVYHGTLGPVGIIYYGRKQTMDQKDVKVNETPIRIPLKRTRFLNLASTEKLGIRIPPNNGNKAQYVIGEGEAR